MLKPQKKVSQMPGFRLELNKNTILVKVHFEPLPNSGRQWSGPN